MALNGKGRESEAPLPEICIPILVPYSPAGECPCEELAHVTSHSRAAPEGGDDGGGSTRGPGGWSGGLLPLQDARRQIPLEQGFSRVALQTFGAVEFFDVGGCPVHLGFLAPL